jgi:hypothetical protein
VIGVLAGGIAVGAAVGPATGAGTGAASAGLSHSLLVAGLPPEVVGTTTGSPTTTTTTSTAQGTYTRHYLRRGKRTGSATGSPPAGETAVTTTTATTQSAAEGQGQSGGHKKAGKRGSITHVWVIALGQGSFAQAATERSALPYLEETLVPEGALLTSYSLVARSSLANDIALLSGQGPNQATEEECPTFAPVTPPTVSSGGLASGAGCIYPATVNTLAGQLSAKGLRWRAYAQDMSQTATVASAAASGDTATGTTATATAGTCVHPEPGAATPSPTPAEGSDYVAFRNPFVYFDSLLEGGACAADDLDLTALSTELAAPKGPPALSWVIPGQCEDGLSDPCAAPGEAPKVLPVDTFLRGVVDEITATAAYRKHGLIVLTFDSAPAGAASTDVGALVLSPFVAKGTRIESPFDAFSLLKSFERLYRVKPLLGHAADPGVTVLGDPVLDPAATR